MLKKIIIITSFLIFFILFLVPPGLLSTLNTMSYFKQPMLNNIEEIYGGRKIEQEFISFKNNLNGFGMSIKNPNLKNKKQIILSLYEGGNLLRRAELNGLNIPDGDFVRFNFSPIPDSMNKKYGIVINSPDSKSDESLGIFLTRSEDNELGDLRVNGNDVDERIAMTGYYQVNKLDLMSYVYKNLFQSFLKDIKFALFYLCFIILMIWILVSIKSRIKIDRSK